MSTETTKPPKAVSKYFSDMGKKGGKAKGASKRRGSSEYYAEIAKKSHAARRANKEKANS